MENKLPKRSEVPVEMTWRLTDIYETEELWNEDYKTAGLLADEIREYEGRVCESADTMLKVFDLYEACLMKVYRLYGYAHMMHDQDTADQKNQGLHSKAMSLDVMVGEKLAFLEPEVLSLDKEKVDAFYEENEALKKYKCLITEMMRTSN